MNKEPAATIQFKKNFSSLGLTMGSNQRPLNFQDHHIEINARRWKGLSPLAVYPLEY